MPIGFAAHTMGTPDLSVPEAAELIARLGYDGIELIWQSDYRCALAPGASSAEVAAAAAAIDGCGLETVSLVPYDRSFNSPDRVRRQTACDRMKEAMDAAAALGAPRLRVLPGDPPEEGDAGRSFALLVETLRELADAAASRGLELAIENHMGTAVSTAGAMAELVAAIDHPAAGILYDPANLAVMGERDDRAAYLHQRDHLRHVHLNDYRLLDPGAGPDFHGYRQRLLGEGEGAFRDWIGWLVRDGYGGFITAEYGTRWFADILPAPEIGLAHELAAMQAALDGRTA